MNYPDRMTNTYLRFAKTSDLPFLRTMLSEAFNWRADPTFDHALLAAPEVRHYLDGWRRPSDFGVIAEREGEPVGAAWVRQLTSLDPGYGYVDDVTPELTVAVSPGHRGYRIGTTLLEGLIKQAGSRNVPALSLSVEDGNAAKSLYERLGFVVVGREGNSDTMLITLR